MPVRPCSAVHHVAQPVGRPNTKQYIVHLSSVPSVLSYRGGVHGLRATATVDDEDDEYEDEEDVDDLDDENLVDGDAIGDGNGGMGGSGVNATAPGSAPEAESGAAAAVAESEVKLTTSESGDDGFDADIHFASAAAAEAAMEMAGVVTGAGAAAGKEGIAGVAATAVAGGRGVGGGSRGGAVRVSALPFGRTGVDALVERVGQRLRRMKSRSVGRRLLARVAAAAVAAAAEEAAEEATGAAAGAAAGAASVTESFQNSSLYPSAVSTTTANAVHSTSAAVLTVQQLSARAARIMRSTPWGRLIRPDVRLPHVQAFTRFLEASHRSLLQSLKIPSSAIFHSYTYLMNSFAAQLTASEARRLKLHPAVAEVERDRTVEVASVHSPEFLKLDSSLWPANGGQSNAGEGVIIGVIDSGIWPEHPSFSDLDFQPFQAILSSPPLLFSSPPLLPSSPPLLLSSSSSLRRDTSGVSYSTAPVRWRGVCSKTDDFTACSRKVVGARYFLKGAERAFGQVNTMDDYRSPRDMQQHGTWCAGAAAGVEVTKGGQTHGTASGMAWVLQKFHTYLLAITPLPSSLPLQSCWWKRRAAAGNAGVEVTVGGRTFGTASGMAPRARLAVYKALWMALDMKYGVKGKGSTSDLIAAAEKAVADGVDVISCSWGGLALYFQDLPYLRGLKAGVVTAFAAGNKGRPKRMSMQGALSNASPFYLTVGARITQQCSPWAMEPPSQHAFSLPSTQVHPPSPPCTTAPSLNILGRDYTAVLTLGNRTKFPRHLPIHPHRPPPLPTAPHRSTMGRDYTAVLNLGDGTTFTGRSLGGNTATASPLPLMLAGDYTTVGLPDDAYRCYRENLDATQVAGKFLVCTLFERTLSEVIADVDRLGAAAVLVLNATVTRETQYRVPFSKTPAIFLEKRLQWFIEEYIRAAGSPSPQLSSNLPPLFPPPPPPILYPLFPPISPLKPPIFIPLLPPRSLDRIPLPFPPLYSNPTLPLGRQISFPSLCPLVSCNVPLLPPLPPFPSPPPSPSPPLSIHLHTHAFHFHHLPVLNFSLPPPPSPLSNPLPPCQCSPTATLSAFTVSYDTNAPQVAYFSSTGPPRSPLYPPALLIRDYPTNDILKPDVVGPGFQLWAAGPGKTAATAATDLPEFGYKSGTSMSTAHLAGIMALIVQNKPSWSPSQVISAITTTAYTRNKNGQPIQRADGKNANGWDYGGGHVDPTRVLDPGLTGETKGDLQAFRGRRESAEVGDGRGERKGDDCMLGDLRLHNVITAVIPGGCTPLLQSRI
ncbi:unnamed protein product [Closterium sp. NIES-64]|nr:unnamed protein product [Closterium sp. NIES-64]